MKPQPPSQSDLLDLIEGRLPPDRVEAVAQAVQADPELARLVEGAKADRERLRELARSHERAAPPGLVSAAITAAERDQLFAEADRSAMRRRIAAGVAIVLLLGGSIGGFLIISGRGQTAERRIAADPYAGMMMDVPDLDASSSSPIASAPDELLGLVPQELPQVRRERPEPPAAALPSLPAREAGDMTRLWSQELGAAYKAQDDVDATVGGMSIAEAAKLARAGRLRIVAVTDTTASSLQRARLLATSSAAARIHESPQAEPSRAFTIELSAREDPTDSALQDAIAALADRLAGDGIGRRAEVRLEAIPQDEPGVGPALPSLRADDVLWFAFPAHAWTPSTSVRVPVIIAPREAGPPAAE